MPQPQIVIATRNGWNNLSRLRSTISHSIWQNLLSGVSVQTCWNRPIPLAFVSDALVKDKLMAHPHLLPCMEVQGSYNPRDVYYDCSMYLDGDIVLCRRTHAIGTVRKIEQEISGMNFCYLEVSWLGKTEKSYLYPNQLIRVRYKPIRKVLSGLP